MSEQFRLFCERHVRRLPLSHLLNADQLHDIVVFLFGATGGDFERVDALMREAIQADWDKPPSIFGLRAILDSAHRDEPLRKGCEACRFTGFIVVERNGVSAAARCDCGERGVAVHQRLPPPGVPDNPDSKALVQRVVTAHAARDPLARVKPVSEAEIERIKATQDENRRKLAGWVQ